jgi:hypothetical protein
LSDSIRIRPAERTDVSLLMAMITELADYERAVDQAIGTESQLDDALFGPHPAAEAVIADTQPPAAEGMIADSQDHVAGFAIYFQTFSTWLCARGLYLEDLYVRP